MRAASLISLLGSLNRPTLPAFSVLFTLEPLARSIIVAVVPLMVLEKFETAQNVSLFFFILGSFGVGMSLAVPWLVSRCSRRGTFAIGILAGILAMLLFMHGEVWSLCLGMAMHLFAAACIDVSLNLYLT